jgi:L,D-transpeptidase ErfK/SrfK
MQNKFFTFLLAFSLTVFAATAVPAAEKTDKKKDTAIVEKPSEKKPEKKITVTSTEVSETLAGDEALKVKDTDENYELPAYSPGARIAIGKMKSYTVGEEDTFLDIARHYGLGYVELRAANPTVDPWSPTPGTELIIPTFNLLPRARQEGIVVNLGKMRMYYFKDPGEAPLTYAIGIGREGLATPTGDTTIIRKTAGPAWYPTERMRKEKPYLPTAVPPGPSNPLGTHAMYLGWPTFLIHGSNKPWGIGRRVSSGCMRMYPEDIVSLFDIAPVGVKVTVVDQPILVGWVNDDLYLEANPSQTQSSEIEYDEAMTVRGLTEGLRKVITDAAGVSAKDIDWMVVEKTVRERSGYPIMIATKKAPVENKAPEKEAAKEKSRPAENTQSVKYN